jgi:hypothetical protein
MVGVELVAERCRGHGAALQQDFQGFGGGSTGAQLAAHDGGWAALGFQIDAGRIDQIAAMQSCRGQSYQKAQRFFRFGQIAPAEVVIEAHAARQEIQQRRAHAQRRRRDGGYAALGAGSEHGLTRTEGEEIQPVDIQIHAIEKAAYCRGGRHRGTGPAAVRG